jgi:hypothetical protein
MPPVPTLVAFQRFPARGPDGRDDLLHVVLEITGGHGGIGPGVIGAILNQHHGGGRVLAGDGTDATGAATGCLAGFAGVFDGEVRIIQGRLQQRWIAPAVGEFVKKTDPGTLPGKMGDLALFNLAIASKLRSCDLVTLRDSDVVMAGNVREWTVIVQQKTGRPVQFALTGQSREAIHAWITHLSLRKMDRGARMLARDRGTGMSIVCWWGNG